MSKQETFKKRFNGLRVKELINLDKSIKENLDRFKDLKETNEFGYSLAFVDQILSLSEGEELDNFIKRYGN